MTHLNISDFQKDMEIDDYYVCVKKLKKSTKNSDPYMSLTLSDGTGRIEAKVWKEALGRSEDNFEENDVVRVKGRIDEYENKIQITAERVGKGDPSRYEKSWFLPPCPYNIDDVILKTKEILNLVTDDGLKSLVKVFFDDEEIFFAYKTAPGAVSLHHAYVGGLAVHTLGVMKLSFEIASLYKTINRDLLLVAALFHDVGKTIENSWDLTFRRTNEGELVGHLIYSRDILKRMLSKVGLDYNLALNLEHCILSHHGQYDFGSPKLPMTREAFALHIADLSDSRFEEFDKLLEPILPGQSTEPVRFLENRRLFKL